MAPASAIDQPPLSRSGVRIQDMDSPRAVNPLTAAIRGLNRWLEFKVTEYVAWRGAQLIDGDPEKAIRFVNSLRGLHARFAKPALSLVHAEAMKIAGPRPGLPAPPTPAEWFAPLKGEPRGFVLYVHGGSFIAERSPQVTALIGKFAAAANARVYAPSYRLAPENPCPAAIEDIEAAFAWLERTCPDEPVVALAESSGSAILLSAIQRMKARGEALPRGLILLSPWVDLSLQSRSVILGPMSGSATSGMHTLAMIARLYLRDLSTTDPLGSPLFGDMSGLPPMLIHASRSDVFYDDAVRLADKVRDAGGDLTLRFWQSESHVWERTSAPAARHSIQLGAEFIRDCLDG